MQTVSRWLLWLAAGVMLSATVCAQQPSMSGTLPPSSDGQPPPPFLSAPLEPTAEHSAMYRDLDLLRKHGFADAEHASISVRVFDHAGLTPGNLQASDFALLVNGTPRVMRLHAPNSAGSSVPALVLLVLPPNQPIVHHIAITNAQKYFAALPAELLPWKVGIFDSNGKMTPFTDGRSQLLVNLDVIDHTREPFQYANNAGPRSKLQWDGSWLLKAEDAIGMMQRFEGPKIIMAVNPLAESQVFEQDGPDSLTNIAQTIGAHIYIANVGGPEVYIPGGDASSLEAFTKPSYHMQVDPQMIAALDSFAYRNSMMMLAAQDTFGGYANSLQDLAAKIHHDLDGNYSLDFDLTAEDTDKGVPSVEVRMTRHDLKVAIVDLVPIGSAAADSNGALVPRQLMNTIRESTRQPVSSADFRIMQHVDYFPLHQGLEPVLPMTASVEWIGKGKAPAQIFVAESLEDPNLASVILERSIEARWNGEGITWERDGKLRPGNYLWRVAVHDGRGKIYSSAEEKIAIPFPRQTNMAVSSLVLGKSCRDGASSMSGLQRRAVKSTDEAPAHLLIDPMHAADCRLKPEATDRFAASDTLHAFVRIYPSEKLEKNRPENWSAKFELRAQSGAVEMVEDLPFATDSGSGYLAAIEVPLNGSGISKGPHTLDVEMRGPGMRTALKASRLISIQSDTTP